MGAIDNNNNNNNNNNQDNKENKNIRIAFNIVNLYTSNNYIYNIAT